MAFQIKALVWHVLHFFSQFQLQIVTYLYSSELSFLASKIVLYNLLTRSWLVQKYSRHLLDVLLGFSKARLNKAPISCHQNTELFSWLYSLCNVVNQ